MQPEMRLVQGDEVLPEVLAVPLPRREKMAALLQRLGPFPFWRGEVSPLEALAPVYAALAAGALAALGGVSAAS